MCDYPVYQMADSDNSNFRAADRLCDSMENETLINTCDVNCIAQGNENIDHLPTRMTNEHTDTETEPTPMHELTRSIPESFYCPITMSVMKDPVMDYEGNTYERTAINAWLAQHDTSPVTRKPLRFRHLAPNRALKDAIIDCMGSCWAREESKISSSLEAGCCRVGWSDTHETTEFRVTVDAYLMDIGNAVGKIYRLDDNGKIAFTYQSLIIVINVPESSAFFFIYSSIFNLNQTQYPEIVKDEALRKNHYPQETFGGSLSLEPTTNDIFYSYSHSILEINSTAFKRIIENFIFTSTKLRDEFNELSQAVPSRRTSRWDRSDMVYSGRHVL